jgi:hypothetical protein
LFDGIPLRNKGEPTMIFGVPGTIYGVPRTIFGVPKVVAGVPGRKLGKIEERLLALKCVNYSFIFCEV